MRIFVFFLLFPMVMKGQYNRNQFVIIGNLKEFTNVDKIYLTYSTVSYEENDYADSTSLLKSSFTIKGILKEPCEAILVLIYKANSGQLAKQNEYLEFFLLPDTTYIEATKFFSSAKIRGSKYLQDYLLLKEQERLRTPVQDSLLDEIRKINKITDPRSYKYILSILNTSKREKNIQLYSTYLNENPNSPLAVFALWKMITTNITLDDIIQYKRYYSVLSKDVRQWPSAISLKSVLDSISNSIVGKFAVNFTLPDTLGKPLSLATFKGKYLLVDFWGTWCKPCRENHPGLVTLFKKYSTDNFTILSIALEKKTSKSKWLRAIKEDSLIWNNACDFKYWESSVIKQFGIIEVPFNILLDPTGKIIARGLNIFELGEILNRLLK